MYFVFLTTFFYGGSTLNNYKFLEMRVDKLGKKIMTQDELAEKLNITRNRIQQLETSPAVIPKDYELKAYCEYFNTTSDYLLNIRETKPVDENIAMINKVTGLNENAINVLKNFSKEDVAVLNFIMKDSTTFSFLVSCIKNYISGCYDTPIHFERGENGKGYSEPKVGVDIIAESPIVSDEEKQVNHIYLQDSGSKDKNFISIPTSMVKTYFLDCIREILEIWLKEYRKE